jgi:uncharacterized protein (TIGR02271 family)
MNQNIEPNQNREYNRQNFEDKTSQQSAAIPVIEEHVHIEKRVVESGVVRVSKKVHNEQVTVDVPLIHEEHDVERVAINQYVDTAPAVRHEEGTMIIPVLREEVVIQKRLVLVEEIRITKKLVQTTTQEEVTLRKEEVVVDRESLTDRGVRAKDIVGDRDSLSDHSSIQNNSVRSNYDSLDETNTFRDRDTLKGPETNRI